MVRGLRFVLLSIGLVAAACTAPVDLKTAMQVSDVSSGWFDAGIVGGKNKLVPSLTFRLKKGSETAIPALSLNVVFKADGETEDWDDVFVQRVDFIDGVQTAPITVRPEKGYTGDPPQSRQDMDTIARAAVDRVQQSGIIFIDEIDKVAGREGGHGPDVSREGVQRDILPIIEGTTVNTKYGMRWPMRGSFWRCTGTSRATSLWGSCISMVDRWASSRTSHRIWRACWTSTRR